MCSPYTSAMPQVAEHTTNKQKMDEFSMVYYNNLLSVPCIMGLMYFFGEFGTVMSQPALQNPQFLLVGAPALHLSHAPWPPVKTFLRCIDVLSVLGT